MKNKLFIVFVLSLFASNTPAQVVGSFCGTHSFLQVWEKELQRLILEAKSNQNNKNQTENTYVIPVVFHGIHGGESVGTFPNILEGQIQFIEDSSATRGWFLNAAKPLREFILSAKFLFCAVIPRILPELQARAGACPST